MHQGLPCIWLLLTCHSCLFECCFPIGLLFPACKRRLFIPSRLVQKQWKGIWTYIRKANWVSSSVCKLSAALSLITFFLLMRPRVVKNRANSLLLIKVREYWTVAKRTFRSVPESLILTVLCVIRICASPLASPIDSFDSRRKRLSLRPRSLWWFDCSKWAILG
jgi:hypothetical protein